MVLLVPDTNPKVVALMKPHSDWFFKMMLPKLRCLERRKVLIAVIISPHTLVMLYIIKACSQNNIAFVCLYPNTTISYSHLMLPGFLSKKHGEKLWRIGKDHLRDLKVAFQKGISTSYWKLSYPSKLEESGASFENLVSGFCKCGFVPFNPNVVYKKLPTENVMSPRKALDQSLLQQLLCIRDSPVGDAEQNKKRTRISSNLVTQSVILILSPGKVSLGLRPSQGHRVRDWGKQYWGKWCWSDISVGDLAFENTTILGQSSTT